MARGKQDNFCRPLEDYGPRYDRMEERSVCETHFQKSCQPVRVSDCMNVTELQCEVSSQLASVYTGNMRIVQVNLFTTCSMNWTMKDNVESVMRVNTVELKNCTKDMVVEYHNKTIYDCRNVTKRHCTTLWTVNEQGEKIWAGNEDDCRDVTWEECKPQTVSVQWLVPQMNCTAQAFTYLTFQNQTNIVKTEEESCTVEKRTVCERVNRKACSMINFKNCTEVSERKSSVC